MPKMKKIEANVIANDLLVEVWWNSDKQKFEANVRESIYDDGYTGHGVSIESSIENAFASRTHCDVEG